MKKLLMLFAFTMSMYLQAVSASEVGFSGMEQIDSGSYLIVHDKKVYENGVRVGLLNLVKGKAPSYSPLTVDDWKHSDGQASDLESVCRIPGKNDEFLLAEAGYWGGQYGRIFHIKLNGRTASVRNVYKIPKIVGSADGVDGDNFEGMVCFKKENTIFVVLGERGGGLTYRNGYLRIGVLNYSGASLSWKEFLDKPVEIIAPGKWTNPKSKRSISDLYMDSSGVIWAAATEDAGDEGPFKSVIYKAAILTETDSTKPVRALNTKEADWTIDGFKVEALSGPSNLVPGSYMSIGTEDESYMGVWRPLFRPTE